MNNALVVSNLIGIIFAITIPRAAYAGIRHHLPHSLARCQKHWLLLFAIDLPGIDMGRIILDLSNEVIKQLDDLEVQRNLPRTELLREAVDQYLVNQSQTVRTSAFGIWQGREEDGVEYQRKLREEW